MVQLLLLTGVGACVPTVHVQGTYLGSTGGADALLGQFKAAAGQTSDLDL